MLMISLENLMYEKGSHADITKQAYFSALIQNSYVYELDQRRPAHDNWTKITFPLFCRHSYEALISIRFDVF